MALNNVSQVVAVHRGPRRWPHLSSETITIPSLTPPNSTSSTTLIVSITSLIGLIVSAFIYARAGGTGSSTLVIGFLAISGLAMIGSLITYAVQSSAARRNAAQLAHMYSRRLREIDGSLANLATLESQARYLNDPPLPVLLEQLRQQPGVIWQRRPNDADFLAVRIGTGDGTPRFQVRSTDESNTLTLPTKNRRFRQLQADAQKLAASYLRLQDVPVTIPLAEHHAIAIVTDSPDTSRASHTAKALVGQIAFHHSPKDVHVIILAPARRYDEWSWAATLPYTSSDLKSLGISSGDREKTLSLLLAELINRENALGERHGYERERTLPLPRIVIVIDAFLDADLPDSPPIFTTPAVALALRRGNELGATVISVCASRAQAPSASTLLIETQFASARVTPLTPDPPLAQVVSQLDTYMPDNFIQLSQDLRYYRPEEEAGLTLPSQVPLLPLLTPPILDAGQYDVRQQWSAATVAQTQTTRGRGKPPFTIPIGLKLGQEPLYLDFVNDGPHGLLIGQTGSGKSELLRSMVAALAAQYSPDMANFVLVDYKAGLALEPFEHLPHTVAFLTNMSQAGQTSRFLKMLEAEIVRRQRARETGASLPRLFVIIDEFAEMVSRNNTDDGGETIIENLLSIVRLGRELDMHLLFASQRPEGSIIQRLRGYVQYRICLRTNSPDDSREVLGRTDAAELPAGIPGRGYLLRGDNELTLFQATRIAIPYDKDQASEGKKRRTLDRVLADRMREYRSSFTVKTWPHALVTPAFDNPTPLVLIGDSTPLPRTQIWDFTRSAQLQPMVIPLGVFDRPIEQRQDWFAADLIGHEGRLTGGPLLVMGDLNSGKTTALQTLLLYLASTYSPAQVRWFVLDPSNAFAEFAQLPHAADWHERGALNIVDGSDAGEFAAFKQRFEQAVKTPAGTGGRPPVLLVVDDYDELASRLSDQLKEIALRAIRNRGQQVYLALAGTRPGYSGVPQDLITMMPTRILLYMADRDQLRSVLGGRLPFVPDPVPGRGFVQTRTTIDEIQIASPVPGVSDAERLKSLLSVLEACKGRWR